MADISAILCVFLFFFTSLYFCIGFMSDISVKKSIYRQYIADIDLFFFRINNFNLQKLCRDGLRPEISTIYRRYLVIF